MDARDRWPRLVVPVAMGLAVAAIGVWVLGIIGLGQFGEDICLDDPPDEATGYESEGSAWPPVLTCVYSTFPGGVLEVDHRLLPTVAVVWAVGVPLVATAGIGMVCARRARSSRL